MFLENVCDMRPHLLEVLLTVLGKEGGKGAFLRQGVWHITRLELIYIPVINGLVIPGCGVCVCGGGGGGGGVGGLDNNTLTYNFTPTKCTPSKCSLCSSLVNQTLFRSAGCLIVDHQHDTSSAAEKGLVYETSLCSFLS